MLRGSVDELGGTVIMVTHDPRVAAYADRVLLLVDGQISSDARVEGPEQVQQLMQAV
jgi:putative ABC transport system ATP-binding protein